MSVIRDCSGQCLPDVNFSSVAGLSVNALQGIGAPMFVSKPNNESNPSSGNVKEALLFYFALPKSHSFTPYGIDRSYQQNAAAQSILSLTRYETDDSRFTVQYKVFKIVIFVFVQKIN